MIKLRDVEVNKLAALIEIPPLQIYKLISMGLFNDSAAINLLIRHDVRRLKRKKLYTVGQITEAMMEKYNVPRSRVCSAMHQVKQKKKNYCSSCGKPISGKERSRGHGKCDHCVGVEISEMNLDDTTD